MAMAGNHFRKMMHQVFIRLAKQGCPQLPFDGHIQATGIALEAVRALESGKYWIPSVPNFPAIDSALVDGDGNVLTVQYFAGKRRGFKQGAFKSSFLNHIPVEAKANIDATFVTYVVPSDQAGRPTDHIECQNRTIEINVSSMETVIAAAPSVFGRLDTVLNTGENCNR